MALPKIEVEVTADTARAERGLSRTQQQVAKLESEFGILIDAQGRARTSTGQFVKMTDSLRAALKKADLNLDEVKRGFKEYGDEAVRAGNKARKSNDELIDSLGRAKKGSGGFQRGIQNAAFQLGDFAVQVGAGTSASIALGQQLPQLLGGFGVLGAVLGAVVAVAVPLSRAFSGMAGDAELAERALGTLYPAAQAVAAAFRTVREVGVQMAEVIINNLDRILITAGAVAAFFAAKWVAAFVAARVATFSLAAALTTLRAALIRTGIGALVVAAGELIYQFSRLVKAAGGFGSAISLVGDVFTEVWERMKQGVSLLGEMFDGIGMIITGAFQVAFSAVATSFNDLVLKPIVAGFNTIVDAANSFGANFSRLAEPTLGEGMGEQGQYNLQGGRDVVSSAAGSLGAVLSEPLASVQKIRDLLKNMKEENISLADILGVSTDEDGEGGAGGGGGRRDASSLVQALATAREQLEIWYAEQREMLENASESELSVIGGYNEAKLRLEEEYQRRLARLKASGNKNMISETLSAGKTILQAVGQTNEKAFKIAQAFGAAEVLVNAFVGASQELKEKGVIGIATAASVIAAGVGFVTSLRSIRPSTSSGGVSGGFGGGFGGAGATTAAPAPAPAPEVSRNVAIKLEGGVFGRDQVINLINEINEAVEDGAVVRLA